MNYLWLHSLRPDPVRRSATHPLCRTATHPLCCTTTYTCGAWYDATDRVGVRSMILICILGNPSSRNRSPSRVQQRGLQPASLYEFQLLLAKLLPG